MPRTNLKRGTKKKSVSSFQKKKAKGRTVKGKGGAKVGKASAAAKVWGTLKGAGSKILNKADTYGVSDEVFKGGVEQLKGKLTGSSRRRTTMSGKRRSTVAKLRNRIQKKLLKLREYKVNRMLLREQLKV